MAILTEEEKSRCRYHLGYMATAQTAASLSYGIPRPAQTIFLLEQAMNLLVEENAIDRVRRILFTLDSVETQLQSALCVLVAEQLGDMKLRGAKRGETYPDLLEREYERWADRLADTLGVPKYAYAKRFWNTGPGNIPVSNG